MQNSGIEEQPVSLQDVSVWELPYRMERQSKLEHASYNVLRP